MHKKTFFQVNEFKCVCIKLVSGCGIESLVRSFLRSVGRAKYAEGVAMHTHSLSLRSPLDKIESDIKIDPESGMDIIFIPISYLALRAHSAYSLEQTSSREPVIQRRRRK